MAHSKIAVRNRGVGLALCCAAMLAGAGASAQQVAPRTAAEVVTSEDGTIVVEPIPVAPDAPAGSSAQIASGAAVGVLVGLAVVAVLLSSLD
jgi:hypothetical protein